MQNKIKALKAAFPYTVPVLLGYLFIGIAFGMLLEEKGFGWGWALLMSTLIYAGSMQFVTINLLSGGSLGLISVVLMTLMVNFRHLFYGLTMLERYKDMGKKKPYAIFSLTDETFSLVCSIDAPAGIDQGWFFFFITLLNQLYWISGSLLGSLLGQMLTFNTQGIDFAMTALFIVIFVEQWQSSPNHLPAITGMLLSIVCLVIFGATSFILPAMLLIVTTLTVFKNKMEDRPQ
jgi:4-azaleucine resistance transporter AzlC